MRDLARVTKNHHVCCSWPLFRPHDAPVRGIEVTEPDLNSPWEHPRSGSYSTPTPFWCLYMQYTQLGSLPLRYKGIPPADSELFAYIDV